MIFTIREFQPADAHAVNALAISAFEQYQRHYDDWPAIKESLEKTAALSEAGEMLVAESAGEIIGAVTYVGPNGDKAAFFAPHWSVMRMLVVNPGARGAGLGRKLAEECVARARRDNVSTIALHTTNHMAVAVAMYERMGFRYFAEAPAIGGVPYLVYTKSLDA